ncbi:MAG: aminopeptidase [Candidatus Aenigmatarchaeota archaeon]
MTLSGILQKSLAIRRGEKVLVLTDKLELANAKKFFAAAKKLSENTTLLLKPVGNHSGEEPSARIAGEMKEFDVIIAVTTHSLTHTKARIGASEKGARIASIPGFQGKMMAAFQADPHELRKEGIKIKKILQKSKDIRVVTPSGTDISFQTRKHIETDDGILRKRGAAGNLPAGETYFAPLEGTANGTIVIDSMKNCKAYAKSGTKVTVKNGKATGISDRKSLLAKYIFSIKNADNIAELGIGTNRKAKPIGFMLQDEKAAGTCHIAFGNSSAIGGKVYSKIHVDAILFKPTIFADDKMIMKNGKMIV